MASGAIASNASWVRRSQGAAVSPIWIVDAMMMAAIALE